MRLSLLVLALLSATACLAQVQTSTQSYERAVQWVDIHIPTFPPIARQARILGTVVIEVRFKGCELDPQSTHLTSGHPLLAKAALEALKQSVLRCGDYPDSTANIYYEFGDYERPSCEGNGCPRLEVNGSRVRILATMPHWQP